MTADPHSTAGQEPSTSALGEVATLAETLVLKESNLFLVSLRDGRLSSAGPHPLGLYYCDCRFLSVHELRIAGARPRLLVASDAVGTLAVHELTNPEIGLGGDRVLPAQSLRIRLERGFAGPHAMRELITVRSYHRQRLELPVELRLGGDFEPMLAIRGVVGGLEPVVPRAEPSAEGLVLRADGRDGVVRSTAVAVTPAPASASAAGLEFELALEPGGSEGLELTYWVSDSSGDGRPGSRRGPRSQPSPEAASGPDWLGTHTRVSSDDELFDRILRRSLLDLRLLRSEIEGQRYYAAGIPWYATLFGRDSVIAAIEMLAFAPEMAADTLRLLGGRLGRTIDHERDEEPGRVLHELRVGEVARMRQTPLARYYGTADATPLFISLVCDHASWSGDLALFEELRPQVDAALGWIDRFADLDDDGLIEYRSRSARGLRNQGWKDSQDGVVDERGDPLGLPIALVEVQGYAVRAKQRIARLFELTGEGARAEELRRAAGELRERIERFWLEERGYYAMALDGDKRASRALASNQGHLLWAGAVPTDRARRIRDSLMSETMFSGWGVRTLADGEAAYNPVAYHTGSIWPHDNALVASGLRRYGFDQDFTRIFESLLEAASQFADYRLPELFAGFSRSEYESPVPYPVACQPQAWAAGAIPYLLRWGLGVIPDGLERRLTITRPSLPRWLNRVEVSDLRLAGASVDLRFERAGELVALADVRVEGDLEVRLEPAGGARPAVEARS